MVGSCFGENRGPLLRHIRVRDASVNAVPVEDVAEVLAGYESRFKEFADAFADGQYVLWIGSGVSRHQMPPVSDVVRDVIELLRANVDSEDVNCAYRGALTKVLKLSSLSQKQRDALDLATPVTEWAVKDELIRSLTEKYSQVLGVRVHGKTADYLLWDGMNVPGTYGNPAKPTGVEHLCIGILMLEGVADSAVTSNWDGLIEKAVSELSANPDRMLRVVVDAEEFRLPEARSTLIKFHGCAVRAVRDENKYRPLLVAREKQISGWSVQPQNQYMASKLQSLLAERSTLVLGLSVQDANMHTMFATSAQNLARHWPVKPPALVLAEPELHSRHELALQLIYGDDFDEHEDDIVKDAVLGSYAQPTLLALVLWTLTEKLAGLIDYAEATGLATLDLNRLKNDLRAARTTFSLFVGTDTETFIDRLIKTVSGTMSMFRNGTSENCERMYTPLTNAPISRAVTGEDFPTATFGRFAVALSLLSRGHHLQDWQATPDATTSAVTVTAPGSNRRVFIVRDGRESAALELSDQFDQTDQNVVLIHADHDTKRQARTSGAKYGRSASAGNPASTGRIGAVRFTIEELLDGVTSADDLYTDFKMEGGFQ